MNSPTEAIPPGNDTPSGSEAPARSVALSRSNRFARACMLCGAALIAWSILAPASVLLWNMLQERGTGSTAENIAATSTETAATAPHSGIVPRANASTLPNKSPASNILPRPLAMGQQASAQPALDQRVLKVHASASAALTAAQQKDRREIMELYRAWKGAWQTSDVNGIMKLYSPQVRFRSVGADRIGYERLRAWFERLWSDGAYTVSDVGQPHLRIKGDKAVLIAGQNYARRRGMRFTSRYFLKKEPIKNSAPASKDTRRWLIVEEEFLPFQGNTDVHAQIY